MSIWIVAAIFLFLVGLSVAGYRLHVRNTGNRNLVPLFFRLGAFLVLMLILGDFEFPRTLTFFRKPVLRAFFDNSVSAAYHQSISTESLLGGNREIATMLDDVMARSPRKGQLELYSFGPEVRRMDNEYFHLDFSEPATNLAAVLRTTHDIPPDSYLAGMIIVTDGQYTMGDDPRQLSEGLDFPVYTVGIGELTPMVDVQVDKVDVPTVGIKGEMVKADVYIGTVGKFEERVHVSLLRERELLGTKVVALTGGGTVKRVRFQFQLERPGIHTYAVQVTSIHDEINIANNRTSFSITTLKDRFQVALITGAASANTGVIKRILNQEKRFQINHFVDLPNGWKPSIGTFWRTKYDLIILDNVPTASTPWGWVKDLQRKLDREPSALFLVAGPNVSREKVRGLYRTLGLQALGFAVAFDESRSIDFQEEHAPRSLLLSWLNGSGFSPSELSLPPIKPYLLAEPSLDRMDVLAALDAPLRVPLLILGTVNGNGKQRIRRASFTSADLWQLYFKGMHSGSAEPLAKLWKSIFGWLSRISGEKDVYFRLNRKTYQQGERIHVSGTVVGLAEQTIVGRDLHVTIRDSAGETRSYPLLYSSTTDTWEASFFAGAPGRYEFEIMSREGGNGPLQKGRFFVEESQVELNQVFLNEKLLRDLSATTGGVHLGWEERHKLPQTILLRDERMTVAEIFHLSHWLPLIVLALLFLTGEWVARRVAGLQ